MFLVLWEFEVKPGNENRFEKIYSPGGEWDSLFRRDPHFIELQLWRDVSRPRIYLVIDSWTSEKSYAAFLAANDRDYHALDAACEELTNHERHVGSWEQPAV